MQEDEPSAGTNKSARSLALSSYSQRQKADAIEITPAQAL
jgi:hypothetical protein